MKLDPYYVYFTVTDRWDAAGRALESYRTAKQVPSSCCLFCKQKLDTPVYFCRQARIPLVTNSQFEESISKCAYDFYCANPDVLLESITG